MKHRMPILSASLLACALPLFGQTDPSIILRGIQPPASASMSPPADTLMRILQARQLQLQNQALEQQNRAIEQQNQRAAQEAAARNVQPQEPRQQSTLPTGIGDQRTLGFLNGRAWAFASADLKISYMSGVFEGVALSNGDIALYAARNLTLAEEAAAVDKFYLQRDNFPVPIAVALRIVCMRLNGESPDAIANFTAAVKQAMANPHP